MAQLEGLEFQIEASVDSATKSLDELQAKLSGLEESLSGLGKIGEGLSTLSNIKIDSDGIDRFTKSLQGLASVTGLDTLASQLSEVASSASAIDSISNAVNRRSGSGSNTPVTPRDVPVDSGTQTQTGGSATDISEVGTSAQVATMGMSKLQQMILAVKVALTNLSPAAGMVFKGITGTISGVVGALKKAYGVIAKAVSIGGNFASVLARINSNKIGQFIIPTGVVDKFKSAAMAAGRFASSLGRILMYRAIRSMLSGITSALKEGINNLYQYSNITGTQFASSMDSLATSMQYLKNSMGAMASPLINAVAPAVDYVISKLVSLMNVFNQVMSRLTGGKTYTRAVKVMKSYGGAASNAGKAVGGAGKAAKKAAKEIKDATLGIDELNIISQNDPTGSSGGSGGSGGGGAGGGLGDYGDMFEEVPIDQGISDFTDQLKAAFDNADWETLGRLLGGKFNDLADMIPWSEMGAKLGFGLNGVIQTLYYFLDEADFESLGSHVADFLNNAMENIDFNFLGRLGVKFNTSLLDFLIGALEKLNWKLLGKSIGDYFRGVFDEWHSWLTGIDWFSIGQTIWQSFKDTIEGIDFASLAQSFFSFLGAAIGAGVSLLAGFISSVVSDIKAYFSQYIEQGNGFLDTGKNIVLGILNGILQGVISIGTWIYNNVILPIIQGFKEGFDIHSPSKVMEEIGLFVVDGFLNGIKQFPSFVMDTVKNFASSVVEWFTGGKDGKGIVENFKETAGNIIDGFKTKISSTYSSVKSSVTTWASSVKEWFTSGGHGAINKETFSRFASNVVTGFKSSISNTYTTVKSSITTWATSVKTWFTDIANNTAFGRFATDVVNGFKDRISVVYVNARSAMTTFANDVVNTFKNPNGGSIVSKFYNVGKDLIQGFIDGVNALWDKATSKLRSFGESVISAAKKAMDIGSPSKIMRRYGQWVVEGFNLGVSDYENDSYQIMSDWANNIMDNEPTVSVNVDDSALKNYMSGGVQRQLDTDIKVASEMTVGSFKTAMKEFYSEYVAPTMAQMAEDVKRQADKAETVQVQVGNRIISDAVQTQQRANGYRFVT